MNLTTRIWLTIACMMACTPAAIVQGDVFAKKEIAQAPPATPSREKHNRQPGVTPEREAAVMTFVKQHHPDLADLLRNLKQEDQRSYGRAIRDLFTVSERLAHAQERDSERYEIDLKTWKVKSRQQYLIAQIKMSDSPKLREQLRQALAEQADLHIMLLELENKRLNQRIQQVQKNIARLKASKEKSVDRKFKQVVSGREHKTSSGADATRGNRPAKNTPKKNPPTQPQ